MKLKTKSEMSESETHKLRAVKNNSLVLKCCDFSFVTFGASQGTIELKPMCMWLNIVATNP